MIEDRKDAWLTACEMAERKLRGDDSGLERFAAILDSDQLPLDAWRAGAVALAAVGCLATCAEQAHVGGRTFAEVMGSSPAAQDARALALWLLQATREAIHDEATREAIHDEGRPVLELIEGGRP